MKTNTNKRIYVNYNEELNGIEIKYGFRLNEKQQKYVTKSLGMGWNKFGKYYYARLTDAKREQFYLDYIALMIDRGYEVVPMKKATK